MAGLEICQRNKLGYCKFLDTCRRKHVNENCENNNCQIVYCEKRHPKQCYYFSFFKHCKFNEFCRYSHETLQESSDYKYKNLSSNPEISSINEKLLVFERDIVKLKEDIVIIVEENELLKHKAKLFSRESCSKELSKDDSNEINDESDNFEGKYFNCDLCDFKSVSKNKLKIHTSLKHKYIYVEFENENNADVIVISDGTYTDIPQLDGETNLGNTTSYSY